MMDSDDDSDALVDGLESNSLDFDDAQTVADILNDNVCKVWCAFWFTIGSQDLACDKSIEIAAVEKNRKSTRIRADKGDRRLQNYSNQMS